MTATTTSLAELMSIVDELRRLDDEELIAAWRANEAAIAQAGRLGGDDQARFRHDAFWQPSSASASPTSHASVTTAATRSRPRPLPCQPPSMPDRR